MKRANNPNLLLLEMAVSRLCSLIDEFVFVGGCATGLLITDVAAPPVRSTIDVDVIVQVLSRTEYYALSDRLRDLGFREDSSDGAPICRWTDGDVILDVMPSDPDIFGFGSDWHAMAMEHAIEIVLPQGKTIRMVSAPYFMITKLEAFDGRGGGDYQLSHDMEDLLAVIDGRPGIVDEVGATEAGLQAELAERFQRLLNDSRFVDSVPGHLPPDEASQARVPIVLDRIIQIAGLK
jgi:predicted nucleotidyltransferase